MLLLLLYVLVVMVGCMVIYCDLGRMLAGCPCDDVALIVVVCYGEEVVGDVVDIVVMLCEVLGLRKACGNVVMILRWKT